MELNTVKLPEHFYLYCALFYADNSSMDYNENIIELKKKIVAVLEDKNIPKLDMPMHAYHYLMGLYNPEGYEVYGSIQKPVQEVLEYVNMLSTVTELQDIFEEYEEALDERLNAYESKFSYIQEYFESHFDFEPKLKNFSITRNWDSSGKCIKTESEYLIFVGWISKGINSNQIMHEILHAYIHECDLGIPNNLSLYMKGAESAFRSYHNKDTIVEESLVRALVVYLDRLDGEKFGFSLSNDDIEMKLPKMYLDVLERDGLSRFNKSYLSDITI